MVIMFYPNSEDLLSAPIPDQIAVLMDAAERYRVAVTDVSGKTLESAGSRTNPRDLAASYNWEAIATVLRTVRDMPEANKEDRTKKAAMLTKLAEVYEVLRSAKMSKLEAVRLALIGEANQLQSGV